jgi:hypothetical protein
MSENRRIENDLDPSLSAGERQVLGELGRHLLANRPVPRASFRGELRRLLAADAEPRVMRPARLRLLVALHAGSGFLLLAVAAAGRAGTGPFAAG